MSKSNNDDSLLTYKEKDKFKNYRNTLLIGINENNIEYKNNDRKIIFFCKRFLFILENTHLGNDRTASTLEKNYSGNNIFNLNTEGLNNNFYLNTENIEDNRNNKNREKFKKKIVKYEQVI